MDAQFICFPLYKEFLDLSSEIKSLMNLSVNLAPKFILLDLVLVFFFGYILIIELILF